MHWFLLIVGTIGSAELFRRVGIVPTFRKLSLIPSKVIQTIRSQSVSDHWRERALLAYAGILLKLSVKLFALLCFALAPVFAVCAIGFWGNWPVIETFSSVIGILASIVAAIAYYGARLRFARV